MDTTVIFLFFVFTCLGVAVGALIQRAQNRRSSPPAPPPIKQLSGEGDVQVFSVWRTSKNKVWVEMDGVRLEDKEALKTQQRQRLIDAVVSLRPWLETIRTSSPATAPVSTTSFQTDRPSAIATPDKIAARVVERAKTRPALQSIVEQIDDVLQTILITSPFNERDISLMEGSDGAVIVKDGKNRYEGVDAVPDPEIKALIRQAIAVWEKGS